MKKEDLIGKVALVTGGNRGIGSAIVIALVEADADIALNYYTRESVASEVRTLVENLRRRCIIAQVNIAFTAEVTQMVKYIETKLGPVNILVNNAGIAHSQTLETITEKDWNEIIDVNLKSTFLARQAVLSDMQ